MFQPDIYIWWQLECMPYMKTTDHNDHIHDETNINQNHANQQPKGNCEASKSANHHTTKGITGPIAGPFPVFECGPKYSKQWPSSHATCLKQITWNWPICFEKQPRREREFPLFQVSRLPNWESEVGNYYTSPTIQIIQNFTILPKSSNSFLPVSKYEYAPAFTSVLSWKKIAFRI